MGRVLTAYVTGLLEKWYAVVIGFGFGFVGFLKDGLGINILLPAWIWWTGAVVTFFGVQFWMYFEIYKDRETLLLPEADLRLAEVVERMIGTQDFWGEGISRVGNPLAEIRERAHLGNISSWARLERESEPLGAVPQTVWGMNQFNMLKFCQDHRGSLEATRPGGDRAEYLDFYFNTAEVNRFWPKRHWLVSRIFSSAKNALPSAKSSLA